MRLKTMWKKSTRYDILAIVSLDFSRDSLAIAFLETERRLV